MSKFSSVVVKLSFEKRCELVRMLRPEVTKAEREDLAQRSRFVRMKDGPKANCAGVIWPGEEGFNPLPEQRIEDSDKVRALTDEERAEVDQYLTRFPDRRTEAMGELAWALIASAEFRSNH